MSNYHEFLLFPNLPPEIRLMIWKYTFLPRIVSLHFTNMITHERGLITKVRYITLGDHHHKDWKKMSTIQKRKRISKILRLTLISITGPVPALSVCHESRDLGLKSGYRAWPLHNLEGCKRDVLWNPIFDTIALVGPHTHLIPESYIHVLKLQFPSQLRNIQKLALPTTAWQLYSGEESKLVIDRWSKFEKLRELVIILDNAVERRDAEDSLNYSPIEFPGDINLALQRFKENGPRDWEIPDLRVVRHENGILGQENIQLRLRCFPCPDLGIFVRPESWPYESGNNDMGKFLTY